MEGVGNSLGLLATAATQDAASTAAVTKESIFRDVQAFLDGADAGMRQRDIQLRMKENELAKFRLDVMHANTAALTHKKKGEEMVICIIAICLLCAMLHVALTAAFLQARKMQLLQEKQLQQQGVVVDVLGKMIKESYELRMDMINEHESLNSEINRQAIVQQRRTERQVSGIAQRALLHITSGDTTCYHHHSRRSCSSSCMRYALSSTTPPPS
jgi:hypothetical protein